MEQTGRWAYCALHPFRTWDTALPQERQSPKQGTPRNPNQGLRSREHGKEVSVMEWRVEGSGSRIQVCVLVNWCQVSFMWGQ
jgi:hypothetical protein